MSLQNKVMFVTGSILKSNPFILNSLINHRPDSIRIIYYHIISDKNHPYYFDNKSITPDEFETQISFFKKHYEIIGLKEALLMAEEGRSLRNKMAITFDDGFSENYSIIAPILIKHNLRATFFLIGNSIDNKDLMWRNKLLVINNSLENDALNKAVTNISNEYNLNLSGYSNLMSWSFESFPMKNKDDIVNSLWNQTMDITVDEYLEINKPYLTVNQIKELSNEDFEFGSHSMSHPIFSKLTYEEFKSEIVNSVYKIEELSSKKVISFSYPFGNRALNKYENILLQERPNFIKTFLGTKNNLKNMKKNTISWERDNLEFSFEIALSRFLLLSAVRNIKN